MESGYKNFEFIKDYIFLKKGIKISSGFLFELCSSKSVPFKVNMESILIDYNVLFDKFDSLYCEYRKNRLNRIKKVHRDMWKEEFDQNQDEDTIPTIEEYNINYLNFIAKQKI